MDPTIIIVSRMDFFQSIDVNFSQKTRTIDLNDTQQRQMPLQCTYFSIEIICNMIMKIKEKIKNLNIIIGCPIGCRYCYARNNCRRFHMTDDFSKPEFFENKLRLFETKKPKVFLLTGMSDLAYWKEEWTEKIFEKAKQTPQNTYVFLTKRPERLHIHTELDNLWFGVTVTCAAERNRIDSLKRNVKAKHYHATFEPLSDEVGEVDLRDIGWIVIGTETGNCKGKISTETYWAKSLAQQAQAQGIPVFMKENLCGIVNEKEMIQQFPKEFKL